MIAQVMRISTVFASMMACSSFALAISIAAAGTIERSHAGCYGCLGASAALKSPANAATADVPRRLQTAFGTARIVALVE